jgi:alpha/beta superfamily hydrolase
VPGNEPAPYAGNASGDLEHARADYRAAVAAERDTIALAADLEQLSSAAGARLEVIAGADHFFGQTPRKVAALTEAALHGLLG